MHQRKKKKKINEWYQSAFDFIQSFSNSSFSNRERKMLRNDNRMRLNDIMMINHDDQVVGRLNLDLTL